MSRSRRNKELARAQPVDVTPPTPTCNGVPWADILPALFDVRTAYRIGGDVSGIRVSGQWPPRGLGLPERRRDFWVFVPWSLSWWYFSKNRIWYSGFPDIYVPDEVKDAAMHYWLRQQQRRREARH